MTLIYNGTALNKRRLINLIRSRIFIIYTYKRNTAFFYTTTSINSSVVLNAVTSTLKYIRDTCIVRCKGTMTSTTRARGHRRIYIKSEQRTIQKSSPTMQISQRYSSVFRTRPEYNDEHTTPKFTGNSQN